LEAPARIFINPAGGPPMPIELMKATVDVVAARS
jgi:hypothetical protein